MGGSRDLSPKPSACGSWGSATADAGIATMSLDCEATETIVIRRVNWSCAGVPTNGYVEINDGFNPPIRDWLTAAGPGFTDFGDGIAMGYGLTPTITIDDGSGDSSVSVTPVAYKRPKP